MLLGWRRRWQAGALLTAAAVNAFTLLPFLRGTPAEAATFGPPPVRLLAWNVNSANRQFGELDRLLRAHDPDVVVVLEVDPAWQRHLEGALAGYPHRQIEARDDNFGLAFFSRTPAFQLRTEHLGAAGLPSIAAELDVDGRRLALLATHPLPPAGGLRTQYRDEQLQAIAEWVRRQDQPVVVVGDLNISPWSPVFTDFLDASGLRNSAEGRGLQGTWPAFFPPLLIPIDHFLHDTGVLVAERAVVRARGSDHRPLVVTFGLR
jgi:endonuclease/exonuclease/phosphatase (EEP) superfamily protein YafD